MSVHPLSAVLAATPHRHPMLLVDRLESVTPGRRGRGVKAVSAGETHRGGGQPGLLPSSLVVDALGQLAIAVLSARADRRPRLWYLAALEEMRFGAPPEAGDLLVMEAEVLRSWRGTSKVAVEASVDGQVRAEGVMVLVAGDTAGEAPPDPGRSGTEGVAA